MVYDLLFRGEDDGKIAVFHFTPENVQGFAVPAAILHRDGAYFRKEPGSGCTSPVRDIAAV